MAEQTIQSIAFPMLTDVEIAELGTCTGASARSCSAGETLIKIGDRDFAFFIVKSGEIEILDYSSDEARTVVVLT